MKKFASRKLIVSFVSLASAVTVTYSAIPETVQNSFFDFLGTLLTFYLLGQGAVDTAEKIAKKDGG